MKSWTDWFLYVAGGVLIICSYALFGTTVNLLQLTGYSGLALLAEAIFAWILFAPLGVICIYVATSYTQNKNEDKDDGDTR